MALKTAVIAVLAAVPIGALTGVDELEGRGRLASGGGAGGGGPAAAAGAGAPAPSCSCPCWPPPSCAFTTTETTFFLSSTIWVFVGVSGGRGGFFRRCGERAARWRHTHNG